MAQWALSYDGVDDYTQIPDSASLNPDHITVEAWFKANAGTLDNQKTLVQKPFTSHVSPWYQYTLLLLDIPIEPRRASFVISVGGANHSAGAINLPYGYGTWHYLAGTYDGETIRLYLDGVLVASNTAPSGVLDKYATVVELAAYPNLSKHSGTCFGGIIDEVRISNIARTAAEIEANWNAGNGVQFRVDANTVALWHKNEGSGPTIFDETANNNDGTIFGATWVEGYPFTPMRIKSDIPFEVSATRL